MKAKFFLAATLMLALAVGSANATPIKHEANKTTSMSKESRSAQPKKGIHHRHHRKHHRRHVVVVKH